MMYFSYYAVSSIFDRSPVVWSSGGPGIFLIALISLDVLFNGFGEETAFRAYWQRLIVHRHGLWPGIIIASISFVLLHLLITHLTVIALLAGIFVACLFGILYVWTGSVLLVGTLHATLNLAPRLLGPWSSDLSLLVINGLVLIIAVILYLLFGKGARAKMILSG